MGLFSAWDSDGSAIGFGVENRDPDCADASGDDADVLNAVMAAEDYLLAKAVLDRIMASFEFTR